VRDVRGPAACVLTTDPMTSPLRRALLPAAARRSGRSLCVVLVDATEQQARSGQRERGRPLGERRMSRHVARAGRLRRRLLRSGGMSFVDGVLVLSRPCASRTTRVVVDPAGLGLRRPPLRAA
jgi:hypothetical protein